jgi:hypothetical protein
LPQAVVYVFDCDSTEDTAEVTRAHGAQVILSSRRGMGNVCPADVRAVEVDVCVMVDGDGTNLV